MCQSSELLLSVLIVNDLVQNRKQCLLILCRLLLDKMIALGCYICPAVSRGNILKQL